MKTAIDHRLPELLSTKALSPEDLSIGDYIAIARSAMEYPSFLWCFDSSLQSRGEPIRIWSIPLEVQPPLKVRLICLPYVLIKTVDRRYEQIDLRLAQIVRFDPRYARRVRKWLRKSR